MKNAGIQDILIELEDFDDDIIDVLENAIECEEEGGSGPPWRKGWDYSSVSTSPNILSQLAQTQLVERAQTPSGSANRYKLSDVELVQEVVDRLSDNETDNEDIDSTDFDRYYDYSDNYDIPDDLFDSIIGHEPVKDLLGMAIDADEQVHFSLQGESSTAKTLFLEEIQRLPGSKYKSASGMTQAGLLDVLMNTKPKWLLFDEIDKADTDTYTPLYELSEHGRVQKTIKGEEINIEVPCNIIVTLNHPDKLPEELRNRFISLEFDEYPDDKYIEVVSGVLQQQYGISEEVAEFIADYQLNELEEKNVREPIQIAKLCNDTVESAKVVIDNIMEYRH